MIIGYGRTSTLDQRAGLEAQERDLRAAGCERIFMEQVSSVDMRERAKLAEALDYLRVGDTLVVTKLDRLVRSVRHLCQVMDRIQAQGASLRILGTDIDTGTANGRLVLGILGTVAAFEREIMLERQREGIAKARDEGRYQGRPATARAKAAEAVEMHRQGHGATAIARHLGIGRASVYRLLQQGGAETPSQAEEA